MDALNRTMHLLDRIALVALKALIVTLVLAYGGVIAFSEMSGLRAANYRIGEAYTFEHLAFTCGETVLEAENGTLVTARRAGEQNYAVLTTHVLVGRIRVEWPPAVRQWSQVPPEIFGELRLSLNPEDLRRLLAENQANLHHLLAYESDALDLKAQAVERFERGADRFRPLLLPHLDFFRPTPVGAMEMAILDQDWGGLWTLTTGPISRGQESSSPLAEQGSTVAQLLVTVSSLLLVLVAAAALLGNLAQAVGWIRSIVRQPAQFAEAPVANGLVTLVLLLVAAALIVIVRVM